MEANASEMACHRSDYLQTYCLNWPCSAGLLQRHGRVLLRGPKSMQKLLEEVRGTPHLLPVLQILLRGQGQGEDETTQQGLLFSVSYDGDG